MLSTAEVIKEHYITITAMLIDLIFLFYLRDQGYLSSRRKRTFFNLWLVIFLTDLISTLQNIFQLSDLGVPQVISTIMYVFITMFNNLLALFFSIYFVHFFRSLGSTTRKLPVFSYIVAGTKAVILVIWSAVYLPQIYRTDEIFVLSGIMSYVVGYGMNMYHLVFSLVFFLRECHVLRKKTRNIMLFAFFVMISTIVLQSIIGDLPHFYYLGATISVMLFFLFVESQPVSAIIREAPQLSPEPEPEPVQEVPVQEVPVQEVPVQETPPPVRAETVPEVREVLSEEKDPEEEARQILREQTPVLLQEYRALLPLLRSYFGDAQEAQNDNALPLMEEEDVRELYDAIAEFSVLFDQDSIESLLEKTKAYALPDADKERIARITESVQQSDWSALQKILQEGS